MALYLGLRSRRGVLAHEDAGTENSEMAAIFEEPVTPAETSHARRYFHLKILQ